MKRVVVTGMGIVSPLGSSVEEFWGGLKAGKNGIGPITKFDNTGINVHVVGEVKDFDPYKYMDKKEATHNDMYTQYALGAAIQAIEDSGIEGNVDKERTGVYIGTGIGGMNTFIEEEKKWLEKGPRRVSPFFIPMMILNTASAVVAIRYKFTGSVMSMVTACASGTNAIGEAARLIRHGYADCMITGGSESTMNGLAVSGFAKMQAVSSAEDPDEACLPFDSRRGGFVMGEGAGVLVLEEYEHAVKRGAKIYAEVAGYGSTNDAYHITSPDPEAGGSSRAIKQAWDEAGVDTDNIYFNAHGTGTHMNDFAETMAIKKAFGEERARKITISSTKSMTGHLFGAAGAIEAVASIMALREGIAPPTINLNEQDPECDLFYTPNVAVEKEFDIALSSSLGFGGHNACIAFKKVK